jgi:hypothetical protein
LVGLPMFIPCPWFTFPLGTTVYQPFPCESTRDNIPLGNNNKALQSPLLPTIPPYWVYHSQSCYSPTLFTPTIMYLHSTITLKIFYYPSKFFFTSIINPLTLLPKRCIELLQVN